MDWAIVKLGGLCGMGSFSEIWFYHFSDGESCQLVDNIFAKVVNMPLGKRQKGSYRFQHVMVQNLPEALGSCIHAVNVMWKES
jgi:hypothetical protein